MANNYEISPNLIDQVQILLKKEAGVDSLNSIDHSLADDSSQKSFLKEAIAGSNSSENVLRCKNCEGELLRGSESIICVYCGHAQLHDVVHQPVSFKSTFAFQWFLQSLNLDGYENVGEQIGGTESSYRGQNSFRDEEISLSDFLDLQLKWADDDSSGFGVKNEEQLSGKSYLSLVGVDVEEILAQDRKDHEVSSVSNEQAIASEKSKNVEHRISGARALSLFENMESSGTASKSGEGENDESVSDWGADFQSAFPSPGHEKPANFSVSEAFSGSNVTTSGINLGNNLETGPPLDSKVSDGNILVAGIESNASFESLPADQQHTTKEDSSNVEKIDDDDDDSFDEWGDFSMSRIDNISQSEPSSTAVPGTDSSGGLAMSDPFDDFTGSAISKDIQLKNNNFTVPDDAWNNFTTPITGGGIQSQAISGKPEQHVGSGDLAFGGANDLALVDGISLGSQDFYVGSRQNKISDRDDSFGLWTIDMHSSDQLQGRESKSTASRTTNELDDSFNLWNNFTGCDNHQQATIREVADNGTSTGDGGIFGEWNDFAGFGVGKKEEQDNSLEVVGGKGNGNQSDSLTFNAWNDFTGSGGVSESKPISNDISSGAWNDFSSLMFTHTNQPQNSNTGASKNQAIVEDDNLVCSLSDPQSLGTQTVNSFLGPNKTKITSDQVPNSLKMVEDNTTLSAWGDFEGATSILGQLQSSGAGSSENELSGGGDLFSGLSNDGKQSTNRPDNQLRGNGIKILDGKTYENDDSFDVWSDFTSSSNAKAGISSLANAPDDKEAIKHGDMFDAIVSSPNVEAGKDTAVPMGKSLEFNLSSPNINSQYVGPVSSMQPDLSIGMFSNQNGSAPVPFSPSEGSHMVRTEHDEAKAVVYVDRMNPSESTSKEVVAETLISEMHDLSFMLESGLSIPKSGR